MSDLESERERAQCAKMENRTLRVRGKSSYILYRMETKDRRQDVRLREEKHTAIYNFLRFLRESGLRIGPGDLETEQTISISYISTQPAVREIKVFPALRVMTRTSLSSSV